MNKRVHDKYHLNLLEEKNREILRLQSELIKWKKCATLDPMTGVKNKEEGFRILYNEIKKIGSNQKALTICFIDVDDLKKINDQFGHCEGDRLLSRVSRLIRENIRNKDVAFRFGGDEFVIIFPDTTEYEAKLVWKRITEEIERFNRRTKLKWSIRLSGGFAECRKRKKLTPDSLIKEADWKMYREKCKNRKEN